MSSVSSSLRRRSVSLRKSSISRERSGLYLEVTKPRITVMVLVTVALGFFMATPDATAVLPLLHTLIGAALACCGSR